MAGATRGRTAERDPSKLAWERAGDQPEERDGATRDEVDSLVRCTVHVMEDSLALGSELVPRQIFVTTKI